MTARNAAPKRLQSAGAPATIPPAGSRALFPAQGQGTRWLSMKSMLLRYQSSLIQRRVM